MESAISCPYSMKIFTYSFHKYESQGFKMDVRKLVLSITEALIIYGLLIVGYGILTIHITQTWSGDWPVDRNIPWLTLDTFIMFSFALSFFSFIVWKYLKYVEKAK